MSESKRQIPNFEESLLQLDEIIQKMEKGDLSLEDSLKFFEQGISLTRTCQNSLKEAEQKVEILLEKQGITQREAFALPDE
ncbi:MAG: xseB [Francisellaceae bacterium]|nr:xseB [Francisellaceae bacterium]